MHFHGLDLSTVATGVAEINIDQRYGKTTITTKCFVQKKHTPTLGRIYHIRNEVLKFIAPSSNAKTSKKIICIEDGFVNSRGGAATRTLAGLLMVIRIGLFEMNILHDRWKILLVPPASLKVFCGAKGNAGKDEVLLSAKNAFPKEFDKFDIESYNDNEVDALVLALIARCAWIIKNKEKPEDFFTEAQISSVKNIPDVKKYLNI